MNDGILSQEEIDALLKGESLSASPKAPAISDFEKDTLGEIGNICMGTAATTLSTLLQKKVSITTPSVGMTTRAQFGQDYAVPYVVVEVGYKEGITGANVLIIKEEDACVIADLMMGGEGKCEEYAVNEIMLSAVGEAMNQMIGSATTSLASMFCMKIDIEPPEVSVVDFSREILDLPTQYEDLITIRFKMVIENLINSEIMQVIPIEASKEMINLAMGASSMEESNLDAFSDVPELDISNTIQPIWEPVPAPVVEKEAVSAPKSSAEIWGPAACESTPPAVKKNEPYPVQPVQFAPLKENIVLNTPQNIGLIMDVPLDISVELGKTRKTIKDVLELQQGSIIQLDKLAGEPVDLLVNGKLIAKGEVVVIDENYGIRITTIISPIDRMSKLQ